MATGKSTLSKEAKTALKAAKEAIKNKEYKEAIKHCKIVFKEDKASYNALVFVGVAASEMGQLEQGVAAYKKAIDVEPEQELAWQGLCSVYEKSQTPEHVEALLETYPKLMTIFAGKDNKKWEKVARKRVQLLQDNGRKDENSKMITSGHCLDNRVTLELQMQLVDMAACETSWQESSVDLVEDAYKAILGSEAAKKDEKQQYHRNYIKFILNRGFDVVKEECANMHREHPSDPYPMAILVEFNLQKPIDSISDDVFINLENLRALDPDDPLIDLADGQTKLFRKNYAEAKTSLMKVSMQELKKYSFPGVDKISVEEQFLLLETASLLDCEASASAAQALQITELLVTREGSSAKVKVAHLKALVSTGQLDQAKELLLSVKTSQELPDKLKIDLKIIEGQIKFYQHHLEDALKCFQEVTVSEPENSVSLYWQGRVYWQQGDETRRDRSKCLDAFMKAAKLDPNHSSTLLYLGYFHQHVVGDLNKAKRCYQQSYILNPASEEAGSMLGDAMIALGEQDKAFDLYNSVTSKSAPGTAKWAWLRLGLYHFKFGDPTDAINSFQSALRADPSDKIAAIKQTLGLYSEAVLDYDEVLKETKNYVPALKGQGETFLRLAQMSLVDFFNGRAVDYVEKAIQTVARASVLRPDLCCLWSILGSACSLLVPVDRDLIRLNQALKIVKIAKDICARKKPYSSLGKCEELDECFYEGSHATPERYSCSQIAGTCGAISESTISTNQISAKIMINDGNQSVSGIKRPSISQHCFIKSIELERNAIIAETVSSDETMDLFRHTTELAPHNEGSIGYAHWVCKTLLDPNLDQDSSLYRYNILQMSAVTQALVVMEKHNDRCHTNPSALMIHGLLLERQKLNRSAVNIYRRCVEELEKCSDDSETVTCCQSKLCQMPKQGVNHCLHQFKRNFSLLQEKHACGMTDEALKQYEAVGSSADENSRLGYALCLYKAGNYERCFQAYKCDNVTQAKTMLFKSSQKIPPSGPGLKALCAIGLLSGDATLSHAVITELEKQSTDVSMVKGLTILKSALLIMEGEKEKALATVVSSIHRYPWLPDIWQTAAEVIIHSGACQAEIAALAMLKAHHFQKSPSGSSLQIQALCNLAAGQFRKTSSGAESCLRSVQRAVFLFPDDVGNWSLLLASLISEALVYHTEQKKAVIDLLINRVHHKVKLMKNSPMEHWSVVLSLWWSLQQCQYDRCMELANTLLGSLYQRGRCFAAAEHCYRQALVRAEGNQALVLMKMCKFALDAAASAKKGFQTVLDSPNSSTIAASVARYNLIKLLRSKDKPTAMNILEEAKEAGDPNLQHLMKLID
ncbi:putative tetratricopeptide repeat protein 37-like [Apostichopus japonicus]|uniref:Putative tetratricopeptide repeat protein 37-like n=1 Tax=Stichopus japonicus TaxID=307972 RepID=A0A2G8K7H0_STIJA|nr:putative tetratricopeptide repeat protein 37-like [Apostichopus japonicus]